MSVQLGDLFIQKDRPIEAKIEAERALNIAKENGYLYFQWCLPEVLAHVLHFALKMNIHPTYCVNLAVNRLTINETFPMLDLLPHENKEVGQGVIQILQALGDQIHIDITELLKKSKSPLLTQQFIRWLSDGWLTPYGYAALRKILNGDRKLEIALLMACPALEGNVKQMILELEANGEDISSSTIITIRKFVYQTLREKKVITADQKSPLALYDVFTKCGFVNPLIKTFLYSK